MAGARRIESLIVGVSDTKGAILCGSPTRITQERAHSGTSYPRPKCTEENSCGDRLQSTVN